MEIKENKNELVLGFEGAVICLVSPQDDPKRRRKRRSRIDLVVLDDRLYIALFSALEQTHCVRMSVQSAFVRPNVDSTEKPSICCGTWSCWGGGGGGGGGGEANIFLLDKLLLSRQATHLTTNCRCRKRLLDSTK